MLPQFNHLVCSKDGYFMPYWYEYFLTNFKKGLPSSDVQAFMGDDMLPHWHRSFSALTKQTPPLIRIAGLLPSPRLALKGRTFSAPWMEFLVRVDRAIGH